MLYGPNTDLVSHPLEKFRLHSFLLQGETVVCASCGSHRTKNKVFFYPFLEMVVLTVPCEGMSCSALIQFSGETQKDFIHIICSLTIYYTLSESSQWSIKKLPFKFFKLFHNFIDLGTFRFRNIRQISWSKSLFFLQISVYLSKALKDCDINWLDVLIQHHTILSFLKFQPYPSRRVDHSKIVAIQHRAPEGGEECHC